MRIEIMKDLLVVKKRNKAVTDSLTVAFNFGKKHKHVLEKIENIIRDSEFTRPVFRLSEYKDSTGRTLKKYNMDRRGFSILAMGFTGKKALKWKNDFFDAVEAMEKILMQQALQQNSPEWIAQRTAGKLIHREKTDVIKDFIDYAITQGGSVKGCKNYYSNIARMENKALFILEQKFKNLRNILNLNQLATITSADGIARKAIKEGMEQKLNYHKVYDLAKKRVITFSELYGQTYIPTTQKQVERTRRLM